MNGSFSFSDRADAVVERPRLHNPEITHAEPGVVGQLLLGGYFDVECVGPDGETRWKERVKNGIPNVCLNAILGLFSGGSFPSTAYVGIVDNAGFTAFAAADTMSSHAGWSEVGSSNFSNSTRPAWGAGSPSGLAVTNASPASFSMTPTTTLTVAGLFITSDNTKGGTTGTLVATAPFSGGNQTCNNGDTLKVTYTLSAASN